jgi:hypothetical protein
MQVSDIIRSGIVKFFTLFLSVRIPGVYTVQSGLYKYQDVTVFRWGYRYAKLVVISVGYPMRSFGVLSASETRKHKLLK